MPRARTRARRRRIAARASPEHDGDEHGEKEKVTRSRSMHDVDGIRTPCAALGSTVPVSFHGIWRATVLFHGLSREI